MSSFEIVKPTLFPGETAWEVMEQSQLYGEKPVRLVFSSECIRTVTSQVLSKPAEFKEFWRVPSTQILKVSWCPELCVISVCYWVKIDEGNEKQLTKVFFIESILGKRCMQSYKKVKPASVQLSPGVRKTAAKKYTVLSNESDAQPPLTTSFRLKQCLNHEKFWRAMFLSENVMVREVFFGVSPTGIRILDPSTLEHEIVFDKLQVYNLKYGDSALKVKYYLETGTGATKLKKLRLHVLPVTAQDILRWYDYCSNFGEEADTLAKLPSFKDEVKKSFAKKANLQRGNSLANIHAKSPPMQESTNLESSKTPRTLAKSTSGQSEPIIRLSNSNKENQPPAYVSRHRKCSASKPPLTKSKSALDAFGRV